VALTSGSVSHQNGTGKLLICVHFLRREPALTVQMTNVNIQ